MGCTGEPSSLTAFSQTSKSRPDTTVFTGQPTVPDLRGRTSGHSPDARHETTDLKAQDSRRICARDATGRLETRWAPSIADDYPPCVGRGQRHHWRRHETAQTVVVLLITQR